MISGADYNLNDFEIKGFLSGRFHYTTDSFKQNYDRCLKIMSELNVHDLRVSIRRLLSFLSLLKSIFDSGYYKSLNDNFRYILTESSFLRDTQVQLLNIRDKRYSDKFLKDYFHYLLEIEESEVLRLSKIFQFYEIDNLYSELFFLQNDFRIKFSVLAGFGKDLHHRLSHTFEKVILRSMEARSIEPASIHKVRIAFKKYRYEAEHLSSIFEFDDNYFIKLKEFQTLLGKIQDAVVYNRMINEYVKQKNIIIPQRIKREYKDLINSLVNEYISDSKLLINLRPEFN